MYKVGIIGERDSVLGFMALGFVVNEASNVEEAEKQLQTMVKSNEFSVIFITEKLAMHMEELIGKYKSMPLPAIISIPGQGDNSGYGMKSIRSAVERAIGADILFKDN